jgi:hypothetical protein
LIEAPTTILTKSHEISLGVQTHSIDKSNLLRKLKENKKTQTIKIPFLLRCYIDNCRLLLSLTIYEIETQTDQTLNTLKFYLGNFFRCPGDKIQYLLAAVYLPENLGRQKIN